MSRIGKMAIEIPSGVDVKIEGRKVVVKGSKGELNYTIPGSMTIDMQDGQINVIRPNDEKENRALHGLTRSLIANMIEGVTNGFQKKLVINGVGYRANLQGNKLVLAVGYSHPVEMTAPDGIEFEVPAPTQIVVKGIDKQLVGETAANIRAVRGPEPYLGKGIRYEDERIRRKAGKAGRAG